MGDDVQRRRARASEGSRRQAGKVHSAHTRWYEAHSPTCLTAGSSAPIFAMHAGDCPKPTVTADGKPVDMKDNGDGTFDCTYMPVCPGAPGYTEVSIKASFSTSASPLFLCFTDMHRFDAALLTADKGGCDRVEGEVRGKIRAGERWSF